MEITYEFVRKNFNYDPEGYLIWVSSVNNDLVGKRAGGQSTYGKGGYLKITFERGGKRKRALVHRLIFLWHNGYLPEAPLTIDHINRNKLDNRIENLRVATPSQQAANSGKKSRNTTGLKGVAKANASGKYAAAILVDGERVYLGCFDTPEAAHAAYLKAAKELFGEFASAG